MTKFKFTVGDKVVVTIPGHTYTTYYRMFEALEFKNTSKNEAFLRGTVGEVFAVVTHPEFPEVHIYAVRDVEGNECLISERGLDTVYYIPTRQVKEKLSKKEALCKILELAVEFNIKITIGG